MKNVARLLLCSFLFVGFSFLNTSFAKDSKDSVKNEIVKDFNSITAILDGQYIDVAPIDVPSKTVLQSIEVLPGIILQPESKANAPPLTQRR